MKLSQNAHCIAHYVKSPLTLAVLALSCTKESENLVVITLKGVSGNSLNDLNQILLLFDEI
jgi:hypothetical protein